YLTGFDQERVCSAASYAEMLSHVTRVLRTSKLHTVHQAEAAIPRYRLQVFTSGSRSDQSTLLLVSRLSAPHSEDRPPPQHVIGIDSGGIEKVNVVDATPIGTNVRSTVATYSGVLDDLRRSYARLDSARAAGLTAGDFSYNTGTLRCPRCEGTGEIRL